jgi:hypothetical protein
MDEKGGYGRRGKDRDIERLTREVERLEEGMHNALSMATKAVSSQSAHEELCSERYRNILGKMEAIPKLFVMMAEMQKSVNMGVGAMALGKFLIGTGFLGFVLVMVTWFAKHI